jgi:hypothetical protein
VIIAELALDRGDLLAQHRGNLIEALLDMLSNLLLDMLSNVRRDWRRLRLWLLRLPLERRLAGATPRIELARAHRGSRWTMTPIAKLAVVLMFDQALLGIGMSRNVLTSALQDFARIIGARVHFPEPYK